MSRNNRIYIKRFGEDVEFQTTPPLSVKAIVEQDVKNEHLTNIQINDQSFILNVRNEDVAGQGIERRQEVVVRGKTYSIIEIGEDLDGMTQFRVSMV